MRAVKAGVESMLIVVGWLVLFLAQDRTLGADGLERYQALRQLLETGTMPDTKYSLIGPLFATPLWMLGNLAGDVEGWLRAYNVVIFGLGLLIVWLMLRNKMDRDLLRKFLLLLVASSMIAPHVNNFYGETFTMLGVGLGILAICARYAKSGWTFVVLGAANTPISLVGLGLVSLYEIWRTKRWRYAIPVAIAGLLVLEVALRTGFGSQYPNSIAVAKTVMPYSGMLGFSYPFFFGVLAILFSFGKGLMFYLPGLLLPVRKRLREIHDPHGVDLYRAYVLWMLFLAGLVIAYASWWSWYGGDWWGPRFFLIGILPASLALAVALQCVQRVGALGNLATMAVLGLSVWIGADSLVLGEYWPRQCFVNYYQYAFLCHFTPEFSSLWYPFVHQPALSPRLWLFAYYIVVFAWLGAPPLVELLQHAGKAALPAIKHARGIRF